MSFNVNSIIIFIDYEMGAVFKNLHGAVIKNLSWFSSIAFPNSHSFPFLSSIANARPHDFIELAVVSLLISLHDVRTHSTTSLFGTGLLPAAVYSCFPFACHLSYSSCILPLKGLFHTNSGAWMYLVQPRGTISVSVLERLLESSVK